MSSKKVGMPVMDPSAFAASAIAIPDPVRAATKRSTEPKEPVAEAPKKSRAGAPSASPTPPSRTGKKQLGVWVTEETRKDLKRAALDSGRSVDDIVNELITDFLRKSR